MRERIRQLGGSLELEWQGHCGEATDAYRRQLRDGRRLRFRPASTPSVFILSRLLAECHQGDHTRREYERAFQDGQLHPQRPLLPQPPAPDR